MRMGKLQRAGRQTRPYHLAHPSPRTIETTSMPVLWQDFQASAGFEEACEDTCRRYRTQRNESEFFPR